MKCNYYINKTFIFKNTLGLNMCWAGPELGLRQTQIWSLFFKIEETQAFQKYILLKRSRHRLYIKKNKKIDILD